MNNKTKIILSSVLSVLFLAIGILMLRSYSAKKAEYSGLVSAAQEELAAAQREYNAINPDTAEGAAYWETVVNGILSDTETDLNAMQQENAALEESIASAQREIDALVSDEDTAYYQQVYNTLLEGLTRVEDYLEHGVTSPAEEDGGTDSQAQSAAAEGTAG